MIELPDVVRNKAVAAGATWWVEQLASLVASVEDDWRITVGAAYQGGTEAFVADAVQMDGTEAVLKLLVPRDVDAVTHEIVALRLAGGDGCARLLRSDATRGALLLERLGRPLHQLSLPIRRRHEILCDVAVRVWRPAPDCGLPTGGDKARWLAGFIETTWEETNRPCSEAAIEHAIECARKRADAHEDEKAVLVHGDVHQWNALEATQGFKLVDPDGLLAEAEYDMGILMREDPQELLQSDPMDRAHFLAARTGLSARAIWEWGVVERVSTGLLCTKVGLQSAGRDMLGAADHVARYRRS